MAKRAAPVQGLPKMVRRDGKRFGQWLDTPPSKTARTPGSTIVFSQRENEAITAKGVAVNPRFLGPGLKRKFAHLLTE